ncbi:Nop16p [Sporobolomyces salmoneus]|uniref:Nop16p n=1 Tax=Sporobolomyces salmoneus TaxID=183962 RepID=UPI00316DC1D7
MVNPRQRRKNRSGGRLKTSKQSLKNKHKVIVKGPEVLAKNWDKTKTVRQNYAALGLLGTLDPRQVGGLEPSLDHVPYAVRSATNPTTLEELDEIVPEAYESSSDEEDEEEISSSGKKGKKSSKGKGKEKEKEQKQEKLAPGMARIIRDENGNVLKIVVGTEDGAEVEEDIVAPNRGGADSDSEEEDSDEEEEAEEKPWGEPMKDWDVTEDKFVDEDEEMEDEEEKDPRKFKQGIPIEGALKRVHAKTDVVRALEERAAQKTKVIRHSSEFEKDWLVSLVEKYDEDIAKMARDRKANVWQKTPGELRRMINKAGGFEKLRAAARA